MVLIPLSFPAGRFAEPLDPPHPMRFNPDPAFAPIHSPAIAADADSPLSADEPVRPPPNAPRHRGRRHRLATGARTLCTSEDGCKA